MAAQVKLPDITGKSIYEGKFRDRAPELRSAGKLTASGDTTEQCLRPKDQRPPSPDVIRKFRATVRPDAGQARVFYGKAYDPHRQWAADMTHGVKTQSSSTSKECVNPCPNTLFQQRILDRKESCYHSHVKAPLGKSHDQTSGLPSGLDKRSFTFGVPTQLDIGAGGLINPNKNYEQVFKEAAEGHELYVKSHADLYPLERVCRGYASENFHPEKKYGLPTPHCNDGKMTKETLTWIHETQGDKAAKIVSKRLDDFREKSQPQLGQVHDPIKDTLCVSPDHTFGILHKPDPYGAGDVIHNRKMGKTLRGKESQRAVVAAMRQQLKKLNYHHFDNLLEAFRFYDSDGKGKITLDNLRTVCIKYRLPVDADILERVFDYCDEDKDGMISYLEFANFLNWKEKLPTGLDDLGYPPMLMGIDCKTQKFLDSIPPNKLVNDADLVPKTPASGEVTPRNITKQIDGNVGNHSTSNGMYNAVCGPDGISTTAFHTYGVPTIRSDLPAPRIKRVDDRKNYGDDAFAYALMNPNLYSQHNVYERDLLKPRTLEEIKAIYTNIGVRMTGEEMEKCYNAAKDRHPAGFVSVEAFRGILDDVQMTQIRSGIHPMALAQAQ